MEMTGAQIVMECLKREGVEQIFGYPGGAVIDLYDELSRHPELNHILVRHEQGATHAADGYARVSGKVGVCLVTSGPGATNTVTGIATAYCDSIPMVVLTGQVSTSLIGNDAFQEVDIVGITRPCTKHNFLVKDIKDLARVIRQAFHIARSGRPGPVLIDLPKDVQSGKTEFIWPEQVTMRSYNPNYKPNLNQLRRAADLILESSSPILLAGGGVINSDSAAPLTSLAENYSIPVTASLMGIGAFPTKHELYLGMLGMHGTYTANKAINNADLIIAVGCRFDDRVTGTLSTFAKKAKIVHIDVDPTSIRKNVAVDVPIVADCREALVQLNEVMKARTARLENFDPAAKHGAWLKQLADWKVQQPLTYVPSDDSLKPQEVLEALETVTGGNAIITTEVGQNQMWAAQFLNFAEPRTFVTSGGLGTMGYGLPAAIGAQQACPDKLVVDIAGDGSIQMNIQELMTAVANDLPVKVLILNNGYLGMVRQWQELFYNRNYSSTDIHAQPDFVKLAEAYGAEGYRVSSREELRSVLEKALASPHTAVIDVPVAREENVYPMVPTGAALDDMLLV